MKDQIIKDLNNYYDGFVHLIPKLGFAILVLLFFLGLSWIVRRSLKRILSHRIDDQILVRFIARISGTLVLVVAFAFILKILGLTDIAVGLLSAAGVTAIILGFAFQDIGENFMAGIFLAFDRPFKSGDLVEVGSQKGQVVAMTIRYTQLKTGDGRDIYVPNSSIIKKELINYTVDGFLRNEITIGMDYGSNFSEAGRIIRQAVLAIPGVIREKGVSVYSSGFGDSAMNLTYTYWIDLFDSSHLPFEIKSAALEEVWSDLNDAGFSLPGNVMELKNYNDIPLKAV